MFKRITEWWREKQYQRYPEWYTRKHQEWYAKQRELINSVKTTFINHLLNHEPALLEAIAKQGHIMANGGRENIAIFISEDTYHNILEKCISPVETVNTIVETVIEIGEPVGNLGEVPIYLTPLMKRAPIFVVGDISWQVRGESQNDSGVTANSDKINT